MQKKAFVCPYHAWAYGLNGKLKNIPGQEAFPDLDTNDLGLTEISAIEKGGIVYVMQEGKIEDHMLEKAIDFLNLSKKCLVMAKLLMKLTGNY